MNQRPVFNRSGLTKATDATAALDRSTGTGINAFWPGPLGASIADLKPETYLARLTGERIGAAYGWNRVYVSADLAGKISVTQWSKDSLEASGGTPTRTPAIEPNGNTGLAPGSIVYVRPVDQAESQYYIVPGSGGVGGAFEYPFSYGTVILDGIVVPINDFRCDGGTLQKRTEWWLIQANGIAATVFEYDPNETGKRETLYWCVAGDCVQSTTPPEGYNSGPYQTLAQCAANCI